MIRRGVALLGLGLLVVGCAMPPSYSSSNNPGPRSRCLTQPQRSENYEPDRPMFFLFCVESP